MGETAAQIESLIGQQREQLESDVQELQRQLRSMVDWRIQVRRHPRASRGDSVHRSLSDRCHSRPLAPCPLIGA